MNLKNFHGIVGDLELSIDIPHDLFSVIFFYEKTNGNKWLLKNIEWTDLLTNNLKKQVEREKVGLRNLLKKSGDIYLNEIEEIFNIKINYISYDNMDTKELLKLMNSFSKKERDSFIKEAIEEEYLNYEDVISQYEKEFKNHLKTVDALIYFDTYKKKNNSFLISTITDSGFSIKSEIPISFDNQNTISNFEISGLAGDTIFSAFLEGYCYNMKLNTNNVYETLESKLKKIKSFFEEGLITKEEYDAKRKEILDQM